MIEWIIWGLTLVIQNAAFTWVSRARNSGSFAYHAIASVFSNGVFIAAMFSTVDLLHSAKGDWAKMLTVGAMYTACTVTGSVLMHWVSIRFLEKGKRRVGSA